MLSDTVARLIRTWVPMGVGIGLAWLASRLNIVIDDETTAGAAGLAVLVVQGAYYGLVALLEQKVSPWFGWLLGVPKSRSGREEYYVPF